MNSGADNRRRLLFAAAAAVIVAATVLLVPRPAPRPAATAPVTTPMAAHAPRAEYSHDREDIRPPRPAGPRAEQAGERVAARFARAFARYETGALDARVRAELQASASRRLAKALLRRPPRTPPGVTPPRASVESVHAGRAAAGSPVAVTVTLNRAGRRSALLLLVDRTDAQWHVTRING